MKGQKYLVVGSGISGIAAVKLLETQGAEVILYDSNEKLTEQDLKDKLPADSKAICVTGEVPADLAVDKIVLSPGVPTDLPWINHMRDCGIPILGEIELGYLC